MLIYQRVGRVRESRAGEAFKRIRSFLISLFFLFMWQPFGPAILRNACMRFGLLWIHLQCCNYLSSSGQADVGV
jgi:ACR3 family arsenite efflux pump ArsB